MALIKSFLNTSAGFFWLEAGVPGLLPYLFEEQKEVEGLSLSELSLLLEDLMRFILYHP